MDEYVSIVIVSHSEQLAVGVKEIISQIASEVIVEVAGGSDDGQIGTSLAKITAAIDRASSSQGTLIFYDMGSAKMNAQFAIETNNYEGLEIIDAPLVEGAYVAAVKASIGKTRLEIKEQLNEFFPNFFHDV